jgi:hypothetical protein
MKLEEFNCVSSQGKVIRSFRNRRTINDTGFVTLTDLRYSWYFALLGMYWIIGMSLNFKPLLQFFNQLWQDHPGLADD